MVCAFTFCFYDGSDRHLFTAVLQLELNKVVVSVLCCKRVISKSTTTTMPPSQFPLRWESTGDRWWYASPIDYAAANGLYDLVTELLHLDTNLLIKLTALPEFQCLD